MQQRVAATVAEVQACYARLAKLQARHKKCEAMGADRCNTDRGAQLVLRTRAKILKDTKAELDKICALLKECPEAGTAKNAGLLEDQLREAVLNGE